MKEVLKKIDGEATARELVQRFTTMYAAEDLELPERAKGDMPMEPNVYTDGSMLNPRGYNWQIGEFGVWWKDREAKDRLLNKHEKRYTHSEEGERGGLQMWSVFNGLGNSSTRCEIAGDASQLWEMGLPT